MMKVSEMEVNKTGIIKAVLGNGSLRHRLLEMGIIPGTKLKLIKKAPLGDPIQIQIRNFYLSIRKFDAEMIEIEEVL